MLDKQELLERIDEVRVEMEQAVNQDRMDGDEAFWRMSGHLLTLYKLEKDRGDSE